MINSIKRADKIETENESTDTKLQTIRRQIETLDSELKSFRTNSDEELAKNIESSSPSSTNSDPSLILRVKSLEAQSEQISAHVDRVEQYNRQYIADFGGIVNKGTRTHPERPTEVILILFE